MKGLHKIAYILLVIGGLNWGLEALGIGIGRFIPGALATLIYALVGISAIVELLTHKQTCKECGTGKMQQGAPEASM